MTPCHHPDSQDLDDWALYGPKNLEISQLVDQLGFAHGLRVKEIEDFILQALKNRLAEEEARQRP